VRLLAFTVLDAKDGCRLGCYATSVGWSVSTYISKYHNAFIFRKFLLLKMKVVTPQKI